MNIGERIHRARRRAQMTLEEVARQVGISRQTMSRYETGIIGNIPSDKIEMMSKVLHVSPAYIMGWEDEEGNNLLKNKPTGAGADLFLSESDDMARKIKELRKQHNLTLEQVAQVVGVGKSTVRKWETGLIANMRQNKIAALAKALHTTPAYLMGWEDEEGNNLLKNKPIGSGSDMSLSEKEQALIMAYRARSDMQGAVDTLLGLPQGTIGNDAANVIRSGERAFVKKNITQG